MRFHQRFPHPDDAPAFSTNVPAALGAAVVLFGLASSGFVAAANGGAAGSGVQLTPLPRRRRGGMNGQRLPE